jgi:hypothetical protein
MSNKKKSVNTKTNGIIQSINNNIQPTNDIVQSTNDIVQSTNDIVQPSNDIIQASNDIIQASNDIIQASNDIIQPSNDIIQLTNNVKPTNDNVQPVKVVRKKRTKNDTFLKQQTQIFEEIKKILNVDKDQSFTIYNAEKAKETILGDEMLDKIKIFYHSSIWYTSTVNNNSKPNAFMTLIKKIFAHFNYSLVSKRIWVTNEKNEKIKRLRYYIVKVNN